MGVIAEEALKFRPRLALALTDPRERAAAVRQFRMLGWVVHTASSGAALRRLTDRLEPTVIVLSTDNCDESGWLTCHKLIDERPGRVVVLVASRARDEDPAFADFVGAASLVPRSAGTAALVDAVHSTALSPV